MQTTTTMLTPLVTTFRRPSVALHRVTTEADATQSHRSASAKSRMLVSDFG